MGSVGNRYTIDTPFLLREKDNPANPTHHHYRPPPMKNYRPELAVPASI